MEVIQTNAPIDLSDIADKSDNILDEVPSKEQIRESKRVEKERLKEEKALAREMAKEAKKAEKEAAKAEKEESSNSVSAQENRALLVRYRSSKKFGKFLKESGFKLDDNTLNKLSEDELASQVERVQFAVANKNCVGMFKSGIMTGLQGIEYVAINNPVHPLAVQGLTATLNASEQFHEVVEEIMLENQMMVYTKPTWRLMYMVASTALTLHNANSAFAKLPSEQKAAILKAATESTAPKPPEIEPKKTVAVNPENFAQKMADLQKEFKDIL